MRSGYSASPKGRVIRSSTRPTGRLTWPANRGMDERRRRLSTTLFGLSPDSELSRRNLSDQATRGRKTKKFVPTTRITITTMAMATSEYDPWAMAAAM